MILDSTLRLECVLAGAVAANQPVLHVDYIDWNQEGVATPPQLFRVALNSTTDVTILAAPLQASNTRREPIRLSIYNVDTAAVTVIVKTDDGTTERILRRVTLQTLETLEWERGSGWYVMDVNGLRKVTTLNPLEGIWTPVFTFATPGDLAVVYSAQVGRYVKKGLEVSAWGAIALSTFTHTTASGNATITGFPFTMENVTNLNSAEGTLLFGGITKANYTQFTTRMTLNTTTAIIGAAGSGQARANVTTADMPTGGTPDLFFYVAYRATS